MSTIGPARSPSRRYVRPTLFPLPAFMRWIGKACVNTIIQDRLNHTDNY